MRRILDDDDDLEEEDELVGRLPLGLEQDSVDGGPPAGVPASQDPSQAEVSEIDDETYERPGNLIKSEGCCLGKGFNPQIMAVDTLVKKLERRKADWQKQPLDIDATIDQVMHPMGNIADHGAVIIEEDDDEPPEDASCDDIEANTSSADKAALKVDSRSEWQNELQPCSQEVEKSQHDGKSTSSADAVDEIRNQERADTCATADPLYAVCQAAPCDGRVGKQRDSGVNPTQKTCRLQEDPPVVLFNTTHGTETNVTVENFQSTQDDLTNADERLQAGGSQPVPNCVHHDQEAQEHSQDAPGDAFTQGKDTGQDCGSEGDKRQSRKLDRCEHDHEDTSHLGSGISCEDSGDEECPSQENLMGLEDPDAEPSQQHDVDEDDEEAMLEAAIAQERHAQQLLAAKRMRSNKFCDGEAEQSEDEAVSSDESDIEDEIGALSVDEIADMMKELREKGLGEAEVASAHAQWLEEEDDKALKNLMRSVKKGFKKGRQRVAQVLMQEDDEDWDADEARERRRALLPQVENQPSIPRTTDEILSQYKRKLAALERSLESPVKPATKALHRREQVHPNSAAVEHVALPVIEDQGESPHSPRAQPWGQLFNSEANEQPVMPLNKPESQSWDAGLRNALGPSLMGKNRKGVNSASIKCTSRNLMACTLGASSSRAASSVAAGAEVQGSSRTEHACQAENQATFTKLREALGMCKEQKAYTMEAVFPEALKPLADADPEVYQLVQDEKKRQCRGIELIASENFTSQPVMEALGSCFTNKYSEGQPGARYYGGNEVVDKVEYLCKDRALEAFRLDKAAWGVNVQPYSGSPANFAVYTALLQPHDRVMGLDLPSGGHLTHGYYNAFGKKISATSIFFESLPYKVHPDTGIVDYDALEKTALVFRPKMLICGASAYPRDWDYARMRKIADSVGAFLLCDMAHVSGLVSAQVLKSPFELCDVVTTTTHKSLRGPRAGMIFYRKGPKPAERRKRGEGEDAKYEFEDAIDFAVFPSLQGGPHNHQIAALCVALKYCLTPEYVTYQNQVVKNSQALGKFLMDKGYKMATGGSDNHLLLWDLRGDGVTGSKMQAACDAAHITLNMNSVAGDVSAMTPGGVRIGLPAMTSRGVKEDGAVKIASFLDRAVAICKNVQVSSGKKLADFKKGLETSAEVEALRAEVEAYAGTLQMPGFSVEGL